MKTASTVCLAVIAISALAGGTAGAQRFVRYGWQFMQPDDAHVSHLMDLAAGYGINEIQLSHGIMMFIDEINESEHVKSLVNAVVARAHRPEAGQWARVLVWSHELNYAPNRPGSPTRVGPVGLPVCLDPNGAGKALLDERKQAYRQALKACPGVDGVVLMFGSSPLEPWQITCQCDWCRTHDPADKAQLIIEQVRSVVTGEFGKELMVRTFIHSPDQLRWIGQALRRTPGVTVMPKCVPQDWEPYYPHDETIGNVGLKEQVVEFDLAGEYWGRGLIPFCQPDEIQYRLQYDRDQGCVGAMGRIEYVFDTPNEVNIYAFSRLLRNPDESVDAIWRDWIQERYGLKAGSVAAQRLISCLRRTFDLGRKMYYAKGFWVFAKSSDVATVGREPEMFRGRSIALYDHAWKGVEAELAAPTEQTLAELMQEKCEAIWLSDLSLAELEQAKPALKAKDYEDLQHRLRLQRRCTEIWRWMSDAIFRYQLYKRERDDRQRALIEGDLRKLDALAQKMEADFGPRVAPGSPQRIRALIKDMRDEFGSSPQATLYETPLLRQIEANLVGTDSAVITWTSDAAGDSRVEYGPTLPRYGFETPASPEMTKQHRVKLTGLEPGARYYFRVKSRAPDGREMVSGDFRFQTWNSSQAVAS